MASAVLVLALAPGAAGAQAPPAPPAPAERGLGAAERAAVVNALADALRASYVLAEHAAGMEATLRSNLAAGRYDDCDHPAHLAEALTRDIRGVYDDKHLRVLGAAPERVHRAAGSERALREAARWENYGFEKLERLAGNVGYLDFREFMRKDLAGDTAAAAMSFLADCNALIVDLRRNGGGDPAMVAFLCSYLFGDEAVHLNDLYIRPEGRTEEYWTDPRVPGRKFGPDKPVFVLTSAFTFSGAEEFAYNLQARRRALLVGEVTGGGAHPTMPVALGHGLTAMVPFARAVNPVTGGNWEGTGVQPDVAVAADQALMRAHYEAVAAIRASEHDPQRRRRLEEIAADLAAALGLQPERASGR